MRTGESLYAGLCLIAALIFGCSDIPFTESADISENGGKGSGKPPVDTDTELNGGTEIDSSFSDTETPWLPKDELIAICASATTAEACADASEFIKQFHYDGDDDIACDYTELTETSVDEAGNCNAGASIHVCHYMYYPMEDRSQFRLPACGISRGVPSYYESDEGLFTVFLDKFPERESSVRPCCDYNEDSVMAEPECECLCNGTSDPNFECVWVNTCTDNNTNLTWEIIQDGGYPPLEEAFTEEIDIKRGENLMWRYATIDDLRTVIRNCPNNETGGSCPVSASCADASCKTEACGPCEAVTHPDWDCHLPKEIGYMTCPLLWSSTQTPKGDTWGINFITAEIVLAGPDDGILGVYQPVGERL